VVQNATPSSAGSSNASIDSVNNRCDKTCEMLETMFKSNGAEGTATMAAAVSTTTSTQSTPPARANVTCFKCGNLGHYATACPEQASGGKRTVINVVGEVMIKIRIGDLILPTRFVLSDKITEPMLGVEWLRCNRMIWDFAKDILLVNGVVFLLIPGEKGGMCRRVVATEKVIVPARSQAIVPGRVEMIRMSSDSDGGVWTTDVSELRNGVNVARAILPESLNDLHILVLNCSDEPCEINAETMLTELSLAQCAEQAENETLTKEVCGQSYAHLSKLLDGLDAGVSDAQRVELVIILREFADVFSTGELDLGETSLAAHRIDTGDAMLMRQTLRGQPFDLLDKIDENVRSMLAAGVIEPSSSPWTSNIVVVKKKDGSLRFCVDYRRLNSVTRKDAYPLPRIDSCLDALSGARYFSSFDLRSSYHQVPMDMRDAEKTSFIVRTGTYRYRRVPFGLCNAGFTFQRVMDLALNGLNFNMCLVYLDDIIVYSSTVEEHLSCLKTRSPANAIYYRRRYTS